MSTFTKIRAFKRLVISALLFLATGFFYLEAACSISSGPTSPVVETGSVDREVAEGMALRSTVDIIANPGDQVRWTWMKNIPSNPSSFSAVTGGINTVSVPNDHPAGQVFVLTPRLEILADSSFNTEDAGDYKVQVSLICNANQMQESPETLIWVLPKILIAPINIAGDRGLNISFVSSVQGNNVGYQWSLNGTALNNGSGAGSYSGVTTNTLRLNNFQLSQARENYTLRVRNTYWTASDMSRDTTGTTAVLSSASRGSFLSDGICSGAQSNGTTVRDPLSGSLFLNQYLNVVWDNYRSGLGDYCSTHVLDNVGPVAYCVDANRFDNNYYFFRVNSGNIDTDVQSQYVYEKQNGAAWTSLVSYFETSWGADAGRDFNLYASNLSDSGNYRLRIAQQPCGQAATFAAHSFTVQTTPLTLSHLDLNGYQATPSNLFIGETGSFGASIVAGVAPNPYTWALQKFNGSSWTDSILDTVYTGSTSVAISPYQNSAASGVRDVLDEGLYRIRFTDSNLPAARTFYTNEIQLNVIKRPQTLDPLLSSPVTVDDGARTYMVANVFGGDGPYTYTWETRLNNFSNWSLVSGCSSTLNICQTPVLRRSADLSRAFRVRIFTESFTDELTSNIAGVNILISNPQVVVPPQSVSVSAGQNASFSVTASGTPSLSYQWRRNGVNIVGGTSSSYTRFNAQTADAGSYDVVVSHTASSNTATSSPATLTVTNNPGPSITQHPASIFVSTGGSGSLTVLTNPAAEHTYQWFFNNGGGFSAISGATNNVYSIAGASAANNGSYKVQVSRNSQVQESATATVTVIPLPVFSTQPSSLSLAAGTAGQMLVSATGTNLIYMWFRRIAGVPSILIDSNGRISGSQTGTLNFISASTADAGTYFVRIADAASQTRDSSDVTLTVSTLPSITSQPVGQNLVAGAAAVFTVAAAGSATLLYEWRKDGAALSGPRYQGLGTNQLRVPTTIEADTGLYTVVVSNSVGSVTSNAAGLNISAPVQILNQPTGVSVQSLNSITLSVVATGPNPLTYQWRKEGAAIPGAILPVFFIPAAATTDAGSYDVVVRHAASGSQAISNAVTVSVTSAPPPPSITLQPVPASAVLGRAASFTVGVDFVAEYNFQWQKLMGGSFQNIGGQTSQTLSFSAVVASDAAQYRAVVYRNGQSANSSSATLTIVPALQFSGQPENTERAVGGIATFTVTASGSGLSYQWFKSVNSSDVPLVNSVNRVAGAQTESLTLSALVVADGGTYRVRVQDATNDQLYSSYATLSVTTPPSITSQPVGQNLLAGAAAVFTVSAAGSATLLYEWRKDGAVVFGARYQGLGTNQLRIPSTIEADTGLYTVVVSNSVGSVTSNAAGLNISAPVQIINQPIGVSVQVQNPFTLSVGASGPSPLIYQWRKNGVSIANATQAVFNVQAAAIGDAGSYDVVVRNIALGSQAISSMAIVSVTPEPEGPDVLQNPTDTSAVVGLSASFTVVVGSLGHSFQWQREMTGSFQNISGANNALYSISAVASVDAGRYRVVVSRNGASLNSSPATLTVVDAMQITEQPVSIERAVGGIANFTVTASGSGLSYRWSKSVNGSDVPLDNSVNRVAGAQTESLTLSALVVADGANYRVRVRDATGAERMSTYATLTVTQPPEVCSAPNVPIPVSPIAGANTTQSPQFSWSTVVHETAGCNIAYHLTLSPINSCTASVAGRFNFNNLASPALVFPAILTAAQTYYWCVRSETNSGVASAWSAPQEFRVQSGDIPVPTVQILPAGTSEVFPAGETEILVSLTGGEAGALAILYELQGSERVLVGQRAYNTSGSVDFIVPLSNVDRVNRFDYQGVTQRALVFGLYSDLASYYFDPDLILDPAPILTDATGDDFILEGNQMRFTKVANATGYEVYRRVGLEDCDNQANVCFLNSSPFKRLVRFDVGTALPSGVSEQADHYIFTDSEQSSLVPLPTNSGISYFVVGYNERSRTVRSGSVSFNDQTMVNIIRNAAGDPISPTLAIRTLPDGRTIQVWATNLGGYGLDNSADLVAHVLYKAIPDNVPPGVDPLSLISFTSLDGLNTHDQTADTLRRITIDGTVQNAILLSEHVGEPGKIYAHLVCLKDVSGNPTNTAVDQHCFRALAPRLIDETAPDFRGVSRLTAMADGKSLEVQWPAAVGFVPDEPGSPVGSEIIQYEVGFTNAFNARNEPDFSRGSTKIVEDTDALSTVITDLQTDSEYAVFVRAVDQAPNRTDGGVILREKTLDNNPHASSVDFLMGSQPGEVILVVNVFDRNIVLGDQVSLAGLQVGSSARAMSVVERLPSLIIGSTAQAATALGGTDQAFIKVRLDLSDSLTIDSLRGFFYVIEVKDQEGNRGRIEGKARLIEGTSNGATGFVGAGVGGGCARIEQKLEDKGSPLVLFVLIGLGFGLVYRSRSRFARRLATRN